MPTVKLNSIAPGPTPTITAKGLSVVGLFAGIGGIEVGLEAHGHQSSLLCEIEPKAQAVLRHRFPGKEIVGDVRQLRALPRADLVAAGFPCQDLSQAGLTHGIGGQNSGLVNEVFRLVARKKSSPQWLLFENVPFMLQLDHGQAMRHLTDRLSDMGFAWAYRVIDTRAFGVPQRRQRVIVLASRTEDPREVLFVGNEREPDWHMETGIACGFYWTEGFTGLGWAVDAVPTLKGGSTIGIPSPPAIWMPDGSLATPDVRDTERLQGFPAGWTEPAQFQPGAKKGSRWKLVGNAVCVPVAAWLGERLLHPVRYDGDGDRLLPVGAAWPMAAWGKDGIAYRAAFSPWPVAADYLHLKEFLQFPTTPLSARATSGFLSRARKGGLRFQAGFLDAVEAHLAIMQGALAG